MEGDRLAQHAHHSSSYCRGFRFVESEMHSFVSELKRWSQIGGSKVKALLYTRTELPHPQTNCHLAKPPSSFTLIILVHIAPCSSLSDCLPNQSHNQSLFSPPLDHQRIPTALRCEIRGLFFCHRRYNDREKESLQYDVPLRAGDILQRCSPHCY